SLVHNSLMIAGEHFDIDLCEKLINAFVKQQAKRYLPVMLTTLSKETGLAFASVTVREQKRIWGSCSIEKNINLNYRLILQPESSMRYVMIHELCHTRHMNHSKRFWNLVEKFDPDWREHRRRLKNG